MAELGNALITVLAVNVIFWLGQVAILNLNPDGPQYYNCTNSMIGQFDTNNCIGGTYQLADSNPAGLLPSTGGQVQVDNGNFFTDTFSAAANWFTQSTGPNYLYNIVAAPKNFLVAIGLPVEMSFAIGALWYGYTIFLIVAFIMGREY